MSSKSVSLIVGGWRILSEAVVSMSRLYRYPVYSVASHL